MSQLVSDKVPNYFFFYAIGLLVITVFDSGASVAHNFVEHGHEGELRYYLSLPISRPGFLVAQSLYGVSDTLIKILPPLLGILYFMGRLTVPSVLYALVALVLLGMGISGLLVSMSFIAFKSVDIYNAAIAGLSALLIRFSTVFYPGIFMPDFYSPISSFNPLTYGGDLARWLLGYNPRFLADPLVGVAVVTALALGTLVLSAGIVDKLIEGVKAA
jgi:ABC-type polysaccharide/polyol phosphate export permease